MSVFWRDNYKAMSVEQLKAELQRLAVRKKENPVYFNPRIHFIKSELLIRDMGLKVIRKEPTVVPCIFPG